MAETKKSERDRIHSIPKLFDSSILPTEQRSKSNLLSSFTPKTIIRTKVVVVGDAKCGKTSLVKCFLSKGNYLKEYLMTTDVDLSVGEVPIPETSVIVDLFLYDMAGHSIFNQRDLQSRYWNDTSYIVCVYDVSSRKSFQSCSKWIKLVQTSNSKKDTMVYIVANKIDLRGDKGTSARVEVDTEEGKKFADSNCYTYFECSVVNGFSSVEPLFQDIAKHFLEKYAMNKSFD